MQELEREARSTVEALGASLLLALREDPDGLKRLLGDEEAARLTARSGTERLARRVYDAALLLYFRKRYTDRREAPVLDACGALRDIRKLGTVFERLLGYEPRIAEQDLILPGKGAGRHVREVRLFPGAVEPVDAATPIKQKPSFFLLKTRQGKARKASGTYYTPDYIVRYIVAKTLGPLIRDQPPGSGRSAGRPLASDEIMDLKVLDPAMGSGLFLVEACAFLARAHAEALVKEGKAGSRGLTGGLVAESRQGVALHCLYGVDLDPRAVELARLGLGLFAMLPADRLERRLKTGDALFGDRPEEDRAQGGIEAADARALALYRGGDAIPDEEAPAFFHWKLAFPEVFPDKASLGGPGAGFSAVIGNPPYGDVLSRRAKEALKRFSYPPTGGRAEISSLFILQGLRLLEPGGRLSFIVPNTLLAGRQFSGLRLAVTSKAVVESILNYRRDRVFPDAGVYAMILRLRRGNVPLASYDADYRCPAAGSTEAVLEKIRIQSASKESWKKVDPLVERLTSSGRVRPLSGIAECRDAGLDYKHRAVGWQRRGEMPRLGELLVYEGERRHPMDPPIVRGTDILRFGIKKADRYLVHDWEKYRSDRTTVLVYTDLMEVPVKILTRQTSDRLIAAIDRDQRYTAKSVHTIIVKDKDYTPEFVCALLNSRVMNRIYMDATGESGRAFAQVKVGDLRLLPVLEAASYREGLEHPEWAANREAVIGWILEGSSPALLDFAEHLLSPVRPATGVIQVLVTELVRRIERSADSSGRLIEVIDRIFSRWYA